MLFDSKLNRGVRKKYIPELNPRRVELARDSSLNAVFEKARGLFFEDFDVDVDSMCLADSGGMLLSVDNRSGWTLASFYENNNLQPSRYKLYVVVGQENAGKEVRKDYL